MSRNVSWRHGVGLAAGFPVWLEGLVNGLRSYAAEESQVICRQWRCLADPSRAPDYVRHLRAETFPALRKIPGFVDASILSRPLGTGVEFLIVTRWDSMDAVASFAGADPEAAVLPAKAADMMIEYDPRARHFEVVD